MTDFISVPFYDLLQENGHVPEIRKNLPPLLAGVRQSVLEIGAGTGLITTSLADWTPAEIFALEPSVGMRAVLLSRLSSCPELLKRVTVLPCDALSVDLDKPVEAMVMINVMYALEPDYRKRLWPVLAAQLAPAGLLVFTWRAGGPPTPRPLQEDWFRYLSSAASADEGVRRDAELYPDGWTTTSSSWGFCALSTYANGACAATAQHAMAAGCEWLHVDFEDQLAAFHFGCLRLRGLRQPHGSSLPTDTRK